MTVKNDQSGVDRSDPNNTAGNEDHGAAGQGDKTVPLSVLEATRADLKGQLARALQEVDQLKAGQPTKAPSQPEKVWSRQELRAAVDSGTITQDQMDETLEHQLRKSVKAEVTADVTGRVAVAQSEAKTQARIDEYVAANPDINVDGSELRERIADEYQQLVADGSPKTTATELAAIRLVCGNSPSAPKGRKKTPETQEDAGGHGGGDGGGNDTGPAWAKGLDARKRTFYQKQIDKGVYSGPKDPRLVKEVEIARGGAVH